jgi:ribose transport system substrate-binding protein
MKKIFALLMMVAMLIGCGKEETATDSDVKQKEIILTVMTSAHPYFQGVISTWEKIAKEENFKLTVLDPRFDNGKLRQITDDIIVSNPDGVVFGPLEGTMSVKMINEIKKAGIPTIAYNVKPDENIVPVVTAGNFEGGKMAGEAAAKMWMENNPDKKAIIGIIDQVGIDAVNDRVEGFMEGFTTTFPNSELRQKVNGYGVRERALKAAEDLLQGNPDINIVFGINDDSALAATDAFSQIGITTPKEAIVAGVDGSEPAINKIKEPNNVYKVEVGGSPRLMAEESYKLLKTVMDGKTEFQEVVIPFTLINSENADKWLKENF